MLKVASLLSVGLIVLGIIGLGRPVEAASSTGFDIKPSFTGGTRSEYGLHFDELSYSTFGAYDWGMVYGSSTWLRGTVRSDLTFPYRYKYGKVGDCSTHAYLQYWSGSQWYDFNAWTLHYLHLDSMPSQWNYTNSFQWTNDPIGTSFQGYTDDCDTDQQHVHVSAEMSGAVREIPNTNETC